MFTNIYITVTPFCLTLYKAVNQLKYLQNLWLSGCDSVSIPVLSVVLNMVCLLS